MAERSRERSSKDTKYLERLNGLVSGVKTFFSSLTLRQNKLECLSFASNFKDNLIGHDPTLKVGHPNL